MAVKIVRILFEVSYLEAENMCNTEISYRMECRYRGAGLTHYVMQGDESPF